MSPSLVHSKAFLRFVFWSCMSYPLHPISKNCIIHPPLVHWNVIEQSPKISCLYSCKCQIVRICSCIPEKSLKKKKRQNTMTTYRCVVQLPIRWMRNGDSASNLAINWPGSPFINNGEVKGSNPCLRAYKGHLQVMVTTVEIKRLNQ